MVEQDIGCLIIADDDSHPERIPTSSDFVQLVSDQLSVNDTLIREYITTIRTSWIVNKSIQKAANQTSASGIHHLPVVDDKESFPLGPSLCRVDEPPSQSISLYDNARTGMHDKNTMRTRKLPLGINRQSVLTCLGSSNKLLRRTNLFTSNGCT